eukprot:CAMPEP_0168399072 /NCGR_PEP_ID=MMETSP0228-20121227/21903_1 /TAXON_ID=133427 /ORGANISM="Protoceratium reticulatum, Strain CCCM 535 (=CCMP 1889)" /LENGTH=75 /DNA_ID=CAMNT_0008412589 /DNA_START=66 /DNA_END=289 /DNA_ORIENTATION=+
MKAAGLLLLPLLAQSAALDGSPGLGDGGALVQGSVLAREVPGAKVAKARSYSESALQAAARAGQGLAAVGALEAG